MFEITRHEPFRTNPLRDIVSFINSDPFFRTPMFTDTDEGSLAVDVSETDGHVVVRTSLPGFKREDIDVQIHDGVLSIKAEHDEETETKDEKFYRKERRYGSVSRRVALPGVLNDAEARAELKDGVLTLRIPQAATARPKQIAIK